MAKSLTEVRNIPRGEEVHTADPFAGNDNNRRVHERRLKNEADLKAAEAAPAAVVPAPAPAAPAKGFTPPAPPSFPGK